MAEMTLILTRKPVNEFLWLNEGDDVYKNEDLDGMDEDDIQRLYRDPNSKKSGPHTIRHYGGRWGSMLMVVGPKILSAAIVNSPPPGTRATVSVPTDTTQILDLAGDDLKITTDGHVIESQTTYTTMERFRGDLGYLGNHPGVDQSGFIQLHPDPAPYVLTMGSAYQKLIDMRAGTNGEFVKINRGAAQTKEMSQQEQAILIHEAVHVGWLTGCISPRPLGDIRVFDQQDPNNPSAKAMREIFAALRASPNQKGSLWVLDW